MPKSGKQAAAAERLRQIAEKLRQENRAAWLAQTVYRRVLEKLQREPVEDFRIDFEDGYGNRPDAEEDQHAKLAAEEVAHRAERRIRFRPLSASASSRSRRNCATRSIRTLDLFVSALCEADARTPARKISSSLCPK